MGYYTHWLCIPCVHCVSLYILLVKDGYRINYRIPCQYSIARLKPLSVIVCINNCSYFGVHPTICYVRLCMVDLSI